MVACSAAAVPLSCGNLLQCSTEQPKKADGLTSGPNAAADRLSMCYAASAGGGQDQQEGIQCGCSAGGHNLQEQHIKTD